MNYAVFTVRQGPHTFTAHSPHNTHTHTHTHTHTPEDVSKDQSFSLGPAVGPPTLPLWSCPGPEAGS